METDIVIYTVSYFAVRLAILIGIGFALYHVARPAPVPARIVNERRSRDHRQLNSVADDRC